MVWVNAVVQGILLGGLYALFAAGLSLIFGVMRLVNLAHGDLSVVAAYVALVLVESLGINPLLSVVIVVPVMFGTLVSCCSTSCSTDTVGPDPMPSILVTFGLAIIIQNLLLQTFSADSQGLDAGADRGQSHGAGRRAGALSGGSRCSPSPWLSSSSSVCSSTSAAPRSGRALRATSDDQSTARLHGDQQQADLRSGHGCLALALAGIAGIMLGIRTTFMPAAGCMLLIFGYEAVIIGGFGLASGARWLGGSCLEWPRPSGLRSTRAGVCSTGHLLFLAVLAMQTPGPVRSEGGGR